jgi:DNA-binding transcriptional MerR regulator
MNGQDRTWIRGGASSSEGARDTSATPSATVSTPLDDAADRMSLRNLTDAAGVSVRTVRYYISEGLLPPPEGAGPGSTYTASHLDRLRLIHQLKATYLPLKEIRRRLSGLDDDGVRAQLNREQVDASPEIGFDPSSGPSMADGREYLSMMESGQTYHTEPLGLALPPSSAPAQSSARSQRPRQRVAQTFAAPPTSQLAPEAASTLWHRIPLGDDAELVISDQTYARHPDRVDWLVRWARKVFS